jgi:rubrerythrin
VSSNVGQSYPYSSESEDERAAAVAKAFAANEGLEDTAAAEATALGESAPGENGAPVKRWTWVCPKCVEGRLHIVGYNRDSHGLYTVCDNCGSTFVR